MGFTDEESWVIWETFDGGENYFPCIISIHSDETIGEAAVIPAGLYLLKTPDFYVSKIEYTTPVIETIDEKFLPKNVCTSLIVKLTTDDTSDTYGTGEHYTCTLNYDKIYEALKQGNIVYLESIDVLTNDSYVNQSKVPGRDMIFSWTITNKGFECLVFHFTNTLLAKILFPNGSHH